jgi:hypothetical protein
MSFSLEDKEKRRDRNNEMPRHAWMIIYEGQQIMLNSIDLSGVLTCQFEGQYV